MEWYYVANGQRVGPVPVKQFDDLVRAGRITPDTLVWREGLAQWQAFGSIVAPSPSAPPPPPPPGGVPPLVADFSALCAECGRSFSKGEMVNFQDAWVCGTCKPIFFQRVREGAPLVSGAISVWRSGDLLVATSGAQVPARCLKCSGAPSGKLIKRTLYWHPPWIYLLILISLLIYIIVALIVRKKAVLEIPICDEHRAKRRIFIAVAWLLTLGGFALLFFGIANESGVWGLLGASLIVAGVVVGLVKGTLVSARKIEGPFVWVRGFSKDYLASLPEFHQPS